MGSKQPLMRTDSVATGRCQQCMLRAICITGFGIHLNSTLCSIVADDMTVQKLQKFCCHGDIANNLYKVKRGNFKIVMPLCGHDANISGLGMPSDCVGDNNLSGGHYVYKAQALSQSTVCQHPFDRLRVVQLRQPTLARFGSVIQNIIAHHKKRNLSGTEFVLSMPRINIADFLALAPETFDCLVGSLTEKKILIFQSKIVRILDHHALEHACEAFN